MFICTSYFKWNSLRFTCNHQKAFDKCKINTSYYTIYDSNDGSVELLTHQEVVACRRKGITIKGIDWYRRGDASFIMRDGITPQLININAVRKICGYDLSLCSFERTTSLGLGFDLITKSPDNRKLCIVSGERLNSDSSVFLIDLSVLGITIQMNVNEAEKLILQ